MKKEEMIWLWWEEESGTMDAYRVKEIPETPQPKPLTRYRRLPSFLLKLGRDLYEILILE
jgi:hypothetical protein